MVDVSTGEGLFLLFIIYFCSCFGLKLFAFTWQRPQANVMISAEIKKKFIHHTIVHFSLKQSFTGLNSVTEDNAFHQGFLNNII